MPMPDHQIHTGLVESILEPQMLRDPLQQGEPRALGALFRFWIGFLFDDARRPLGMRNDRRMFCVMDELLERMHLHTSV